MATIRGYTAVSLDGYIARADGGIDWLDPFGQVDYGYDGFIAEVETVVIGRRTYDQIMAMAAWPYEGKRGVVITHRPVEDLPPLTEVWTGDVSGLVPRLRAGDGDVWVAGGAAVQQQFLEAEALDRIEVHLIPVLLGTGIPLWPETDLEHRLTLRSSTRFPDGMVRLDYDIARVAPGA